MEKPAGDKQFSCCSSSQNPKNDEGCPPEPYREGFAALPMDRVLRPFEGTMTGILQRLQHPRGADHP
jgi:hypothetical protein